MEALEYLVGLSVIKEIGPVTQRALLRAFGSAEAVFRASTEELLKIEGVGEKRALAIKGFNEWNRVEAILKQADAGEIDIIGIEDPEYPENLRQLADAPVILYKKGRIEPDDRFAIAVVGPRAPSSYGLRVTEMIVSRLVKSGLTVVSGLARGIDTQAHRTALAYGGRTIAVLGSGIDVPYPAENHGLMKRIQQSGAVLSEFPPGTKPDRGNFPVRNRIISGLSLGVLVVEASSDSGALITARYALAQNREVFAVPGMITSNTSKGTHSLLRQGAILVEGADDIMKELAPQLKGFIREFKDREVHLTPEERIVIERLSKEPLHIDQLTRQCELPLNKILGILTGLELKGLVRQTSGKRFYLI